MAFEGWISWVRVDSLTRGAAKLKFNMFYGKLDQLFFDPARWWWWPEATLFLAYLAKEMRKWITNRLPLRSRCHTNGGMKFPPPHPPSGTSSDIKLRHKKRQFSFGQSFIRWSRLTNGGKNLDRD